MRVASLQDGASAVIAGSRTAALDGRTTGRCGMLIRMPDTTVRVSSRNRDRLRAIADAEGLTMDEALALLLRRHRQREIGHDLSSYEPDAADRAVLDTGADTVARG